MSARDRRTFRRLPATEGRTNRVHSFLEFEPDGNGYGEERRTHLAALVAALVEVGEQGEEEHAVAADPPDEGLRVVAVDEQQLECVHHDGDELGL